ATVSSIRINHGLAFLALSSFMISFFVARIFTTLNPDTVIVSGGIHFHHFWYGLAMVVTAGWLGIVSAHPALNRVYATVFGFGGGLIGDEVGLLLTFGNYYSQLTYEFFVGFICVLVLLALVVKYRERLERDVMALDRGETTIHIGVVVAAFSALAFSFGFVAIGSGVALAGIIVALAGIALRRRP
ncbi:MAG TPA: hypothetical protein VKF15_05150, partial [Nitrososphaerales archaeon]|nr:hypothetical protein [Nitrososphaerales archaeon]